MNKVRRFILSMGGQNALSAVFAVILGLIAGFIVLLFADSSNALTGFKTILTGGFSDMFNLGMVLYYSTPLIMTGLSVGFAMKTGLFNIGASGQFTFGIYASVLVGIKCAPFLPGPLLVICAALAGMLAGAVWGTVPGLLKAYRNVHEVITCIMMNYVGMYLVNYLVGVSGILDSFRNAMHRAPAAAELPKLGLNRLFSTPIFNNAGEITSVRNSSIGSGIVIALIACIILYTVLEKTKFGYELKACGFNRDASRYAGISENRGIVLSMTIAGALAGLGGAMVALAGSGYDYQVIDVLANEGFMGIPVALLGLSNPLGIIFSGFLVAYLTQSGFLLQSHGFAPEVIEIIVAVIIYFSALALLLKGAISFLARERKAATADAPGDTGQDEVNKSGAEPGQNGADAGDDEVGGGN